MSKFSSKGLSLHISIPLPQGTDAIGDFSDAVDSYTHTISANGGFTSAEITLVGNHEFLEEWLQYGLCRDIKVFGPSQEVIWEGFVNQIDVNMGAATFSRGPITNLGNFVWGVYSQIHTLGLPDCLQDPLSDAGEPVVYDPGPTLAVQDDYSISKYGIWEKMINIGEATICEAERVRDIYLKENAYPEGNPSLSLSDNEGELSVKLSCRGYVDWLGYTYNIITPEGTPHVWAYTSTIIKNILANDDNDVISTSYDKIDENMVIKDTYTSDYKTAKTLIDEAVSLGGGTDDRWTFGIYKDRKAVFTAIPTEVEYVYYKAGTTQMVETLAGEIIDPWDVVPCKWVAIPTFLASFNYKLYDIRNDPRVFFAEEVVFTAPDKVSISGAKVSKLAQYLTKLGLGGV